MKKPEIVHNIKSEVGECPLWNRFDKKLYWVDILPGIIYCYNPENNIVEKVYDGDVIGGYTIQKDGSLLFFMEEGAIKLWKNNELITIKDKIPELKGTRFNDVIADPAGRVFCGTMPDESGNAYLFRLDTDGTLDLILKDVRLANGLGFTPDKKYLYFTDSKKGEIYIFDYDQSDGSIKNKRLFHKVIDKGIEPDGLTVDAEGYIWSAQWNGHCIKRYSPDGQEDLKIDFPAKKITCMTFAGDDYSTLYITSAMEGKKQSLTEKAGSLFRINLEMKGLPENLSRISL